MPSVFPTGVFIQDIKQTASSDESEGINTMTVTLTNQQKANFNVKNGKQGSSAEATAQMEQHAKDYIAAELTDQKAALEQAIETAKTDINNSAEQANTDLQQKVTQAEAELSALIQNKEQDFQGKVDEGKNYIDGQLSAASQSLQESINTKVTEAMATAESTLLAKVNAKFIEHYQKGYLQMPGMPSPLEDTSMHYAGYSWHEVNYDGNFFRAKGRNAKTFSSVKLTAEQIKNGTYAFGADEQEDAIREIWGHSKTDINFTTSELRPSETGAFLRNYAFNLPYKGNTGDLVYGDLMFRASRVVPTAEENRSRNLTFAFWVLIKNE